MEPAGSHMKLLDRFERIRVVNLPSRADRREEMAAQMARVGVALGTDQARFFPAIRPEEAGGFPTIGARGCFLSHLQVLRDASGSASILVLEDDVDFIADIANALPGALEQLPESWGIFYGGGKSDLAPGTGAVTKAPAGTPIGTTHFIAFRGSAIARAVSYLEAILQRPPGHPDGGPMHVDGAYSRFRADNPDIETWVALPELGYQRPSRTDIHALRWFDRTPVIRDAVTALRRLRPQR